LRNMHHITQKRIATGTAGLDKMLCGGLLPGGIYSVVGPPGSGKTMLASQFLLEGVKRGENVLLAALDEQPVQIRENLAPMFGPNFDKISVLDGTLEMKNYEVSPLRDVSITRHAEVFGRVFPEIPRSPETGNPELTISGVQEMIKAEVRDSNAQRLVIDSATALRYFMMPGVDQNTFLQSFLRFLSDLEVTTVITIHEGDFPVLDTTSIEYVMSRGVIRLHRWLHSNGFKLGLSVEKFRGSEHEEEVRRTKISPVGLQIIERQSGSSGGG